jgi:hypothetical protein
MNILKTIFGLAIVLMVVLMSCEPSAKKVEKAQENLNQAEADYKQNQIDSVADYVAFRDASEARIDANDKAIAQLKSNMKSSSKKWQAEDQKLIDELELKNIAMRRKIEIYREEGKDKWLDFKQEFNHDMDELGDAIKGLGQRNTK